jgi:hypothetical protein
MMQFALHFPSAYVHPCIRIPCSLSPSPPFSKLYTTTTAPLLAITLATKRRTTSCLPAGQQQQTNYITDWRLPPVELPPPKESNERARGDESEPAMSHPPSYTIPLSPPPDYESCFLGSPRRRRRGEGTDKSIERCLSLCVYDD